MDDLHQEIKDAFDAEWGHPAEAPFLAASISAPPAMMGPRLRLVPALAAAGVAGLFVAAGAFAVLSGSPRSHKPPPVQSLAPSATPLLVEASPGQSPSPRVPPEPDQGPPPAGIPLLYYIDPRQPTWLVAMDWTGRVRGTVKLPPEVQAYGSAFPISSPDGSRLLVRGSVYATTGADLGAVAQDKQSVWWADDSRHLCGMTPGVSDVAAGTPTQLFTVLPGQAPRMIATVGRAYNQSGSRVYACSFKAGVAVVVQAYNENAFESWLVSLADGRILHHQAYSQSETETTGLEVASNGRYIAENHVVFNSPPGSGFKPGPALIRDARTGMVVMTGQTEVLAFSADGGDVLLQGEGSNTDILVVKTTQTQRIRWSLAINPAPRYAGYSILVRPDSTGFVLPQTVPSDCGSAATPCGPGDNLQDLLMVTLSSKEQVIAQRVTSVPNH